MKKFYKVKFLLLDKATSKLLYLESHELHSYEMKKIGEYAIKLQEHLFMKYKQSYIVIKIE